ncbi:MAG TPA: hypothetical protein VLF40_05330 [Candidatus Saccharimonadales bacterium]|nr:hypothetical protein [Candidatus Saccharimonadales bacterium]
MLFRKNKAGTGQGDGRRNSTGAGPSKAFSYYTYRSGDTPPDRIQMHPEHAREGEAKARLNLHISRLPYWGLVAIALVCLVKVLYLTTTPKVIVLGKTDVSAVYLQPNDVYTAAGRKLLTSSITNRSKLTADLTGTAKAMQGQFPELQAVSLSLPLMGNRPIMYVQVAQPSLVLRTARGDYALNGSGVVLARLHTLPTGVPTAVDQSAAIPRPGKQFLPGSTVSFMRTVAYQLDTAHLKLATFTLPPDAPYEVDVRLEGAAYYIRCNLQEDALEQSGAIVATLQKLGGGTPGSYLDVRVPGRVYYK